MQHMNRTVQARAKQNQNASSQTQDNETERNKNITNTKRNQNTPNRELHKRKNNGRVLTTWDMSDRNTITLDVIAYPMLSVVHMVHGQLVLWVFCLLDRRRVIDQDR